MGRFSGIGIQPLRRDTRLRIPRHISFTTGRTRSVTRTGISHSGKTISGISVSISTHSRSSRRESVVPHWRRSQSKSALTTEPVPIIRSTVPTLGRVPCQRRPVARRHGRLRVAPGRVALVRRVYILLFTAAAACAVAAVAAVAHVGTLVGWLAGAGGGVGSRAGGRKHAVVG